MRRRHLLAGAAAGAALLARPTTAPAQVAREADALTRALRIEHVSVFAYDHASEHLDGADLALARRLRTHEAAHASALAKALSDIQWPLPAPPAKPEDVEVPEIRSAIDGLHDRAGALALIDEVERISVATHRAAVGRLRDGRFIQLAATILAAEACHVVAWRAVR